MEQTESTAEHAEQEMLGYFDKVEIANVEGEVCTELNNKISCNYNITI